MRDVRIKNTGRSLSGSGKDMDMAAVNESAENYLETILMLSRELPVVRSVDISNRLGFKKSSVSIGMKNLRMKKLITVTDAGFIYLTDEGRKTLSYLDEKISDSIKEDVLDFLENANLYYEEPVALSGYEKTGDNKYAVTCSIRKRKKTLFQITISVSTKEQADAICSNWDAQYINTYTGILDLLLN